MKLYFTIFYLILNELLFFFTEHDDCERVDDNYKFDPIKCLSFGVDFASSF